MSEKYDQVPRAYEPRRVIDPLKPLTPEELASVVPITFEEIDAALRQGRKEADIWDLYL